MKPTFLGLGAAKAGTTSLFVNFEDHPEIGYGIKGIAPDIKEIHYFDQENFQRNDEWYFSLFQNNKTIGEICPSYLFIPECRDRIYETFGTNIKFIVSLRNPIDRAISQYCHVKKTANYLKSIDIEPENLSFKEAIEKENERIKILKNRRHFAYISRGFYAEQLKWYFEKFDPSQFFIYLLENYKIESFSILKRICQFLEVDENFEFPRASIKKNSKTNMKINFSLRQDLNQYFENSYQELEDLLKINLNIWRIK